MATFTERGGRWLATIRLKGYQTKCQTFRTEKQARAWAETTKESMRRGELPGSEAKRTFEEVLPEYLDELATRHLKTEGQVRQQLADWCKVLGKYSLARITRAVIQIERNKLTRSMTGRGGRQPLTADDFTTDRGTGRSTAEHSGKQLSGAAINRRLAALSSFFTWAVDEMQYLKVHPMISATKGKGMKLKENGNRERYLTAEERERLFEACKDSKTPALYTLVVVACLTGMRQMELLNLTWPDVDIVAGTARVWHSKNGKPRTVPVRGPALEALRDWRDRDGVSRMSGRVFGLTCPPTRAWYDALDRAGISDFHFHDLRHSAASLLITAGEPLERIARVLGHKSIAVTQRYAHLTDKESSDAMDNMIAHHFARG